MFKGIKEKLLIFRVYVTVSVVCAFLLIAVSMCAPKPDPDTYRNPNDVMEQGR